MGCIPNHSPDVTNLLKAWTAGDQAALDSLMPHFQRELHEIARRCLQGDGAKNSLQPTELVHEAFLRLVDLEAIGWQNRAHFLAMAARLMRRVLVDLARERQAEKRGGDAVRVTFDEALLPALERETDLVRLDDALRALAAIDERKGRVVELRFFAGLSVDETAEVLQVSGKTVARDWEFAKAWLLRELSPKPEP